MFLSVSAPIPQFSSYYYLLNIWFVLLSSLYFLSMHIIRTEFIVSLLLIYEKKNGWILWQLRREKDLNGKWIDDVDELRTIINTAIISFLDCSTTSESTLLQEKLRAIQCTAMEMEIFKALGKLSSIYMHARTHTNIFMHTNPVRSKSFFVQWINSRTVFFLSAVSLFFIKASVAWST